jgi:thiopurine S-methyltransferase
MDHEFWLERWRTNQTGFHQADFNARLIRHWPALGLATDARVFVPLCGKSRDMVWLAGVGHAVTGVELSPTAVEAFFAETTAPHLRRQIGPFTFYDGGRIGVYCGDFFELTEREIDGTAGVFDRGALIALPPPMRRRYADHLLKILPVGAQSLLLTIEYDQERASGPPFSVQPEEVTDLFAARCSIELLERSPTQEMPPRFHAQGIREAGESVYRIIKER